MSWDLKTATIGSALGFLFILHLGTRLTLPNLPRKLSTSKKVISSKLKKDSTSAPINDNQFHTKLHHCRDAGEVYGNLAAILVLIRNHQKINRSLVFNYEGTIAEAEHRLQSQKWNIELISKLVDELHNVALSIANNRTIYRPPYNATYNHTEHTTSTNITSIPYEHRTVAVMPFLGSTMGAGHSNIGNRLTYLQACFWSLYAVFPHIVAVVKSREDHNLAWNVSGLPFYDVIQVDDLPKAASLPVATVQQTKLRIADGRYDFDFVFFTESDQVAYPFSPLLMVRIGGHIYGYLNQFPTRLLVPHRLMPYPSLISAYLNKTIHGRGSRLAWHNLSCCLPRNNCPNRNTWVHVSSNNVSFASVDGLDVALGNTNFHVESYHACRISNFTDVCP